MKRPPVPMGFCDPVSFFYNIVGLLIQTGPKKQFVLLCKNKRAQLLPWSRIASCPKQWECDIFIKDININNRSQNVSLECLVFSFGEKLRHYYIVGSILTHDFCF